MSTIMPQPVQSEQEIDDDDAELNHYIRRSDITESIVTGKPVTALCGETFVVHAQGDGLTGSSDLKVCMDCEFIYSGFRS